MLNYEQLKYVLIMFKKIHYQEHFIKNYIKDFPNSRDKISEIISEIESLTLFESILYINNVIK